MRYDEHLEYCGKKRNGLFHPIGAKAVSLSNEIGIDAWRIKRSEYTSEPISNNLDTISHRYFYYEGNITRSIYGHERGFWLVCGKKLHRCDEHGKLLTQDELLYGTSTHLSKDIPPIDSWIEGWLWRDLNEGWHPNFDRYNKYRNLQIIEHTDEKWSIILQKAEDDRKKHKAIYDTLSDLEKSLYHFDWSYQYSDAHGTSKATAEHAAKLLPRLEAMPIDEANALLKKHGQGYGIDLKHLQRLVDYWV